MYLDLHVLGLMLATDKSFIQCKLTSLSELEFKVIDRFFMFMFKPLKMLSAWMD